MPSAMSPPADRVFSPRQRLVLFTPYNSGFFSGHVGATMAQITSVHAYANNEITYIAWSLDAAIPNCRGFDVRRIDVASGKEESLPAWVPFQGQSHGSWQNKTTAIWPVQRTCWKDLTWRDE